jgi:hypothetical protein
MKKMKNENQPRSSTQSAKKHLVVMKRHVQKKLKKKKKKEKEKGK